MGSITRKDLVETLRFLATDDYECDFCPMQDVEKDSEEDECSNECKNFIMKKAAQMLEDDGMIMKVWWRRGEK